MIPHEIDRIGWFHEQHIHARMVPLRVTYRDPLGIWLAILHLLHTKERYLYIYMVRHVKYNFKTRLGPCNKHDAHVAEKVFVRFKMLNVAHQSGKKNQN